MTNTQLRFQIKRIVLIFIGICLLGGGKYVPFVIIPSLGTGMLQPVLNVQVAMAESGEPETAENGGEPHNNQSASEKVPANSKEMKLVFEGLEAKRQEIESRSEALKAEEKRLEQLKREIEEKIETLADIQKKVATDLAELEKKKTEKQKQQEAAEEARIKQLVKAYSAMKPRKAAVIINNMDIETAKKILMNMKGDQAGLILSYVKSDHAAKISRSLALKPQKDAT
jgi:flagellar motility protein MotE (MotC chaperone)